MTFDDRDYTQDALIKQLGMVELHGKDGSATEAGCRCIETKHLYFIEGLSEEGTGFALNDKEKRYYAWLSDFARDARKNIEHEEFDIPHNPRASNLSLCERKRRRCIKKLMPSEKRGEIESAHAVCISSIPCP